jgi:hypothetical protein
VVLVVFTSGVVSSTGLGSIGGWLPVGTVRQDVSMMVLTMGEQGLVVYLVVIVDGPVAGRFLESWPKTFTVGRPPLLMYGGRQFWWCRMC